MSHYTVNNVTGTQLGRRIAIILANVVCCYSLRVVGVLLLFSLSLKSGVIPTPIPDVELCFPLFFVTDPVSLPSSPTVASRQGLHLIVDTFLLACLLGIYTVTVEFYTSVPK